MMREDNDENESPEVFLTTKESNVPAESLVNAIFGELPKEEKVILKSGGPGENPQQGLNPAKEELIPSSIPSPGQQREREDVEGGYHSRQIKFNVDHMTFWKLYLSQFLSSWGDNMWTFAVPMVLSYLFRRTLLPSAIFAFSYQLLCVFAGPWVGDWIDRTSRLRVILVSLGLQNFSVIVGSFFLLGCFRYQDDFHFSVGLFLLMLGLNVCGSLSALASMAENISVTKDWIVVLCQGDSNRLAETNAAMRRISLGCGIVVPLMMGAIFELGGSASDAYKYGIGVVIFWNLLSVIPEYYLIYNVYSAFQALIRKDYTPNARRKPNMIAALINGWEAYFRTNIVLPSIAYIFLYVTVLSPGVLMVAYLTSALEGYYRPGIVIGLFRAASAVSGFSATFIMAYAIKTFGLTQSSFVAIWCQIGLLVPCLISFILPGSGVYLFLMALVFSRCALWSFDLGETQIMQEGVPEAERGAINGFERSLINIATLIAFSLGIVVPNPLDFVWLVGISAVAVLMAAAIYSLWLVTPAYSKFLNQQIERS